MADCTHTTAKICYRCSERLLEAERATWIRLHEHQSTCAKCLRMARHGAGLCHAANGLRGAWVRAAMEVRAALEDE